MKGKDGEFCHYGEVEVCKLTMRAKNFPLHFHDHLLAGCMLSGKRMLICSNRRIPIGPYELVVIQPCQTHGCASCDDQPSEWLCLHISTSFLQTFAQCLPINDQRGACPPTVFQSKSTCLEFVRLAESLGQCGGERQKRKILDRLGSFFLREGILAPSPATPENKLPDKALAALREQATQDINLDCMASMANMEKFKFLRLFRQGRGITPWSWLESLRVNKGRQMLLEGASLSETALECGFYDQSHFSKRFKAITGLTPGFFRKACHSEPRRNSC